MAQVHLVPVCLAEVGEGAMQAFTAGKRSKLELPDVLFFLIENRPGRTAAELAKAIFGNENGYQQRVNNHCITLVKSGEIERHGKGGPADPFRYFPRLLRFFVRQQR